MDGVRHLANFASRRGLFPISLPINITIAASIKSFAFVPHPMLACQVFRQRAQRQFFAVAYYMYSNYLRIFVNHVQKMRI